MLQFFRKIRRNLLENGKSLRYLKYAIGEILLVVIGILIALQVDNCHEIGFKGGIKINETWVDCCSFNL